MFIVTCLFAIAKTQNQPTCPPANEQIEKMWHIYTIEYYSAVKKNEILPLVTVWMNPEDIMFSAVSRPRKTETT